jgi:CRISPR-associated protein Cas6
MAIVDVQFKLVGNQIPADHGYHLFSAVSHLIPELHGDEDVGLLPISGRLTGHRSLALTEGSRLSIRLPSERISQVLPLAGKGLSVAGCPITVGVPTTRALVPAARLYSRLVIIKGYMDPEPFLGAVRRQLAAMAVRGRPGLVEQENLAASNRGRSGGTKSAFLRRTTRIRDKEVVGFAVRISELTAEESVRVQERGIGGRRRFGCGLFIPDRR